MRTSLSGSIILPDKSGNYNWANMRIRVPILFYHKIGQPPPEVRNRHLYVTPENFAAQMEYLKRSGCQAISLSEFGTALKTGIGVPQHSVIITFDDGHRDNYENAFPVLQRYNLSATIFLVAELIGKNSNWQQSRKEPFTEPLLSWAEIREMQKGGIIFGSHTCTHPKLNQIPLTQARQEIISSRSKLEDGLGVAVESFCYPYGEYNQPVVDLVQEAGYAAACVTEHGNRHSPEGIYTLKRVFIWSDTPLWRFVYYLTSFYDWEQARKRQRKAVRKGKTIA